MKITIPKKISLNKDVLACIGLFFFLIKFPVRSALARSLQLPLEFNTWFSIVLMYIPLFMIPFFKGQRRKILDFILIWIGIFFICIVTYLFHPEYGGWLFDGEFNIWLAIFRPDQAIYLYLFIKLVNDPDKIFKTLKRAGFVLFLFYIAKFLFAQFVVGSWEGTGIDREAEGVYNLAFGYEVLFLFVLYTVLGKNESKYYYILSMIILLCILVAGSRGPLVGVGLILAIQIWEYFQKKPLVQRIIVYGLFTVFISAIIVNFEAFMLGTGLLLQKMGISSRTVMMLSEGEIASDNGRLRLYEIALDLIQKGGLFGHGIYGDRYTIASVTSMWIGYCHNIFLEILVDFGYLAGGLILLVMAVKMIRNLLAPDSEWKSLFLIFLITASQLLLSGSYWYNASFWGCLAISVCWHQKRNQTVDNQVMKQSVLNHKNSSN